MAPSTRRSILGPAARFVSHKVISFEVSMVDRYVPDKLLLGLVNALDTRVPPKTIDDVVNRIERLPPEVRASIITAADEYVPDAVSNSRKASAVIAGVAKYVPDRVIPPESADEWATVKMRFHIPTLVSRGPGAVAR
jgi:hypothetical protein